MVRQQRRTRVFISFDFDNDARLKDALIGQSRYPNSPFEVADWSLKEKQPERNWEQKAKERIRMAQAVVVMCGERTNRALGVAKELSMAQQLGKPYFLLAGHSDRKCSKPSTSKSTDKVYNWTWKNLEALFAGRR